MSDPSLPEDDQKIRRSIAFKLEEKHNLLSQTGWPSPRSHHWSFSPSPNLLQSLSPIIVIIKESIESGERDITNVGGHMYFKIKYWTPCLIVPLLIQYIILMKSLIAQGFFRCGHRRYPFLWRWSGVVSAVSCFWNLCFLVFPFRLSYLDRQDL